MLIEETTLTLPSGKTGERPLVINLAQILIAEQRQNEVAAVTPMKAPELLAVFNESWRNVDRIVNQLTSEKLVADRELERRRAVLLLDEVPALLIAKGVDSTKDTRDAAISNDPTYQAIQDRLDQLTVAVAYLKGKLKSFENAFTSVKKIMGEDTYNMNGRIGNKNLSGTSEPRVAPAPPPRSVPADTAPPEVKPTPIPAEGRKASSSTPGWGHPRYNS